jgi:hypothetical protein
MTCQMLVIVALFSTHMDVVLAPAKLFVKLMVSTSVRLFPDAESADPVPFKVHWLLDTEPADPIASVLKLVPVSLARYMLLVTGLCAFADFFSLVSLGCASVGASVSIVTLDMLDSPWTGLRSSHGSLRFEGIARQVFNDQASAAISRRIRFNWHDWSFYVPDKTCV